MIPPAVMDRARLLVRPGPVWWAMVAAVGLTGIGIAAIATVPQPSAGTDFAAQQMKWLLVSLIVMAGAMMPDMREIGRGALALMIVSLLLLTLVILPGIPDALVPTRNGTRAWINLQFMLFQPSELAKIAFVLALARYLRFKQNYRTLKGLLVPFGIMFIPVVLILKEPDLGTAILFAPALFFVLIAAGAKLRHMGTLVGLGVLLVAMNVGAIYMLPDSAQLLKPHQRERIKVMIDQMAGGTRYIRSAGYQAHIATTLIGAGEIQGYGKDRSQTIIRYNWLPEAHNDMVFAVIVNRWGLLGGAAVLLLFGVLIASFLVIAGQHKDPFARLATVGFAGLFFSQVTINVGMSMGVLPIIGITLPFVSYGGSSLVATYAMLGLVINFATQRQSIINRPSFEYDTPEALTV